MLTEISKYLGFQEVLLLISAGIVWLAGGTASLWCGARFIARLPNPTVIRSFVANVIVGVVCILLAILLNFVEMFAGSIGAILGWAAGIVILWIIIQTVFTCTIGKAALAWLATIPAGIGTFVLLILGMSPYLKVIIGRDYCGRHLYGIGRAVLVYAEENDGVFPENLECLVRKQQSKSKDNVGKQESKPKANYPKWSIPRIALQCPAAIANNTSTGKDYFYLPPNKDAPAETIIACDYRQNHLGEGRNVLFKDGKVRWYSEEDFQQILSNPCNAAFAKALSKAEAARDNKGTPHKSDNSTQPSPTSRAYP